MRKLVEVTATNKQVQAVLSGDTSKSQKMKDLFDMGLEIKDIAVGLGVRYNFVYNVVSNYVNMNGIQLEAKAKTGKKEAIIEMFLAGKTNKEISIDLKTNYNYVFNVIKSYKAAQLLQEGEA